MTTTKVGEKCRFRGERPGDSTETYLKGTKNSGVVDYIERPDLLT